MARLPEAKTSLWGRGVVAVTETGQRRIASLPPMLGDDLAASLSFAPSERVIVPDARVLIHTPRTVTDLLRRRVRAATAIAQLQDQRGGHELAQRTSASDLRAIVRAEPRLAPHVVVFLAVALLARLRASRIVARGDFSTWLRDDSSRR